MTDDDQPAWNWRDAMEAYANQEYRRVIKEQKLKNESLYVHGFVDGALYQMDKDEPKRQFLRQALNEIEAAVFANRGASPHWILSQVTSVLIKIRMQKDKEYKC